MRDGHTISFTVRLDRNVLDMYGVCVCMRVCVCACVCLMMTEESGGCEGCDGCGAGALSYFSCLRHTRPGNL